MKDTLRQYSSMFLSIADLLNFSYENRSVEEGGGRVGTILLTVKEGSSSVASMHRGPLFDSEQESDLVVSAAVRALGGGGGDSLGSGAPVLSHPSATLALPVPHLSGFLCRSSSRNHFPLVLVGTHCTGSVDADSTLLFCSCDATPPFWSLTSPAHSLQPLSIRLQPSSFIFPHVEC